MSHTPGPWDCDTLYTSEEDVPFSLSKEVRAVMSPNGDVAYLANALDSDQTIMANARLIAAAPELLAALKAALPVLESDANRREIPDWERALVNLARAAIAKAEGGGE